MSQKGYLVLQTGEVFAGERFGAEGDVTAELVFTTGMTGYLETLTDPSYYGQMVVQTFPLIGNYGVIPPDFESEKPSLSAYIVRQWCREPSNFRCEGDLDTFLKAQNIPGLSGVDTRAITRIIRERGVLNACLCADPDAARARLEAIAAYRVARAIPSVTCAQPFTQGPEAPRYRVALWDFGAKANIRRELIRRGCEVVTMPAQATAEQIAALNPDGVMLSNGPGDPADNPDIVAQIGALAATGLPIFGICMGHQLLALSQGCTTRKLKYGHRGANQPVRDLDSGRVYITSQNHGYAVDTLPESVRLRFENANDGSCEGLDYRDIRGFSVQFHPEAAAGPLDTGWIFDRFMDLMGGKRDA
ncbi:MAG: carbamoyl phosphate synthase small subunit [Christensenellales bacterium]